MNTTPQWQPIEKLALIAPHIDGMLEEANEQHKNLQEARPKPHVLDDYTVGRVIELSRWKAEKLTTAQQQEVERLVAQMKRLREVVTTILALANELKEGTIERVLGKSDAELGLEMLLRRLSGQ